MLPLEMHPLLDIILHRTKYMIIEYVKHLYSDTLYKNNLHVIIKKLDFYLGQL